ncbi:MAG: hypothetical protein QM756_35930 [Polyangiaceae bacterium]
MYSQQDMLQEFLDGFEEELALFDDVGRRSDFDELERIFRRMQGGIFTYDPRRASPQERPTRYRPPTPGRPSGDQRPPPIESGEVTFPANERLAVPKLRDEATLGWLDRGGTQRRVPRGNRGVATVNPDGSVDYTVLNPELNHVLWRRRIAGPAASRRNLDDQRREDVARRLVARVSGQPLRRHSAQDVGPDLRPLRGALGRPGVRARVRGARPIWRRRP